MTKAERIARYERIIELRQTQSVATIATTLNLSRQRVAQIIDAGPPQCKTLGRPRKAGPASPWQRDRPRTYQITRFDTHYKAAELEALATLAVGQTDNLKIETLTERIWLARTSVADGEPYNNRVTHDRLVEGIWVDAGSYYGGPTERYPDRGQLDDVTVKDITLLRNTYPDVRRMAATSKER